MSDAEETLWAHVLERWEDEKRHQAFLQFCLENRALASAAMRYRSVAEASGGSDASPTSQETPYRTSADRRADAKKRLGGIAALAMSSLEAERTTPGRDDRVKLALKVFAALFLLASLAALAYTFTLGAPAK